MSAAPPEEQRLPGLDALKGIAIILVVAIHAAPSGAPGYREIAVDGIARLAVPLFLIVTGFLIGWKRPSREKRLALFWKFLRLHVLYGALYWAAQPLLGVAYPAFTFKSALMHFAAFSYPGQFYLFALTQLYLASVALPGRSLGSAGLLLASAALGAATVALVAWSFASPDAGAWLRLLTGQAEATLFLWLFPVCLGMWIGARFARWPRSLASGAACLSFAIAALGVAILDLPPTDGAGYTRSFPYARWSIGLAATWLAFTLPWAAQRLRLPPLAALGRESFGIFVLNPLALGVLQRQLGAIDGVAESALYTAVTLAITFLVTRVLRKRIPIALP